MEEEKTVQTTEESKDLTEPQPKRKNASQIVGFGIAGLLLLCLILWLIRFKPPEKSAGLVINEVVSDNRGCYAHPVLGTPHWVELHNGSEQDINLAGYGLSDEPKNCYRYRLPEVILPAGGYLLVFFTGGTPQADDNPLCTGFGLNRENLTLVLADADYHLLDELRAPALAANQAYARVNATEFALTDTPTPASENVFD